MKGPRVDVVDILIRPHGKRGHYPVLVEIDWGNLPERVIKVIGYWKVLRYVCEILAHDEHVPPEHYAVNVQELLEQAATERSEAGESFPVEPLQLGLL